MVIQPAFRSHTAQGSEVYKSLIFCPIAHSHPIAEWMPLEKVMDGHFWKEQDAPYLEICDELIVFMLDGWEQSSGMKHEIERAQERGIKVIYERA